MASAKVLAVHVALLYLYFSVEKYDYQNFWDKQYFAARYEFGGKWKYLAYLHCPISEMASSKVLAVHVALLYLYFSVEKYDYQNFWEKQYFAARHEFGGRFKYLTNLHSMGHTLFFGSCVSGDLTETVMGRRTAWLRKLQDFVVASVLFPTGMLVSVIFWGIWVVDRELILPAVMYNIVPAWINHVRHTTVVPVMLLEMYLVHHRYPSRKAGLVGNAAVLLAYLIWVLIVAHVGGFWVYPFMAKFNTLQFTLFCAFVAIIGCAFYLLGEFINTLFWGPTQAPRKEKKKA